VSTRGLTAGGFTAKQTGKYADTYFPSLAGSTHTGLTAGEILLQSRQVNMQAHNFLFRFQTEDLRLDGSLQSRQVSIQAHNLFFKCQTENLQLEISLQSGRIHSLRVSLHSGLPDKYSQWSVEYNSVSLFLYSQNVIENSGKKWTSSGFSFILHTASSASNQFISPIQHSVGNTRGVDSSHVTWTRVRLES